MASTIVKDAKPHLLVMPKPAAAPNQSVLTFHMMTRLRDPRIVKMMASPVGYTVYTKRNVNDADIKSLAATITEVANTLGLESPQLDIKKFDEKYWDDLIIQGPDTTKKSAKSWLCVPLAGLSWRTGKKTTAI